MEEKAKIYTYTIVNVPTEEFKGKTPYLLALIEDSKGGRVLTRVEGYEKDQEVSIGQEVSYLKDDEQGNPIYQM